MTQLFKEHRTTGRQTNTTQTDSVVVRPPPRPAARRRRPCLTALLTTRLTDGGRVHGAGSRPLLVKMVVQVPGCKESRADKLTDKPLETREACRVSICVSRETDSGETGQRDGQWRDRTERRTLQEYRGFIKPTCLIQSNCCSDSSFSFKTDFCRIFKWQKIKLQHFD